MQAGIGPSTTLKREARSAISATPMREHDADGGEADAADQISAPMPTADQQRAAGRVA